MKGADGKSTYTTEEPVCVELVLRYNGPVVSSTHLLPTSNTYVIIIISNLLGIRVFMMCT